MYLTPEVIEHFPTQGSQSLLQLFETPQEDELAILLTEILLATEDGSLSTNHVEEFLSALINNETSASVLCQLINVFPTEKTQQLLVQMHQESKIQPETIARYIGPDLLKATGLVPKDVITKSLNSTMRDVLYTQKKYNLLHEEVEGYAKLVCELYLGFRHQCSIPYMQQMVEKLIGHFSLDPNRVLDVFMDVASYVYKDRKEMVLAFLRQSKWRQKQNDESLNSTNSQGSLTPSTSKIFGLRILKGECEFGLLAILIKEGLVDFGSVYTYLEDDMGPLEQAHEKEMEKRSRSNNALAMAAPLEGGATEEKDVPISSLLESNSTYNMLKGLLGNGLYWPSLFILTKHPFLATVGDIGMLMNQMFDDMIGEMYRKVDPFRKKEEGNEKEKENASGEKENSGEKDKSGHDSESEGMDLDSYDRNDYVYNDVSSTFSFQKNPVVDDYSSLFSVMKQFLKFGYANLAKRVDVLQKVCAIAMHDLNTSEERREEWFHIYRNYIFPAVPLIEENSIAANAAYAILAHYSREERYSVYGELYQVLSKNNPHVRAAYLQAEKSTKDVLKRLSKENVRPMMRRLAKLTSSNPLPCLVAILTQIESYDNLIPLVVETARYFNAFAWDTLTVAIMMRLTAGRATTQDNGLNERKWLQSLASFVGSVCSRYHDNVDLHVLLTFLLKSFHTGDFGAVIVMKEIVAQMGGFQASTNLTLGQIDLINSGPVLAKTVYKTINDTRYDRGPSGRALWRAISEIGAKEFLVVLCHLHHECAYSRDPMPLKVLTSRVDDVSELLHFYCQLMTFFKEKDMKQDEIEDMDVLDSVSIPWAYESTRRVGATLPHDLFSCFWTLQLYDLNYSPSEYKGKENDDRKNHEENAARVDKHIADMHKQWVQGEWERPLLEQCIFPRAVHSSFDAVFCARFLFLFSDTEVVSLLNNLGAELLFGTLFTLTPTEAENLGLFYADLLKGLEKRVKGGKEEKEKEQEKEQGEDKGEDEQVDGGSSDSLVSLNNLLRHLHENILFNVTQSLEVKDYMCRRNAITFLKNLLGVFPVVVDHCEVVLGTVTAVFNTEAREDLKLSSSALMGHIRSRSADWVELWDFVDIDEEEKALLVEKKQKAKELRLAKERAAREEERRARAAQVAKQREAEEQERVRNHIDYSSGVSVVRKERAGVARGKYDDYEEKEEKKDEKEKEKEKEKENEKEEEKEEEKEKKKEDEKERVEKSELKARLEKAKKDYQMSTEKKADEHADVREKRPLPPQSMVVKGHREFRDRYRYNRRDRDHDRHDRDRKERDRKERDRKDRDRKEKENKDRKERENRENKDRNDNDRKRARDDNDRKGARDEDRKRPRDDERDRKNDRNDKPDDSARSIVPSGPKSGQAAEKVPLPPPPPPPLHLKQRDRRGKWWGRKRRY